MNRLLTTACTLFLLVPLALGASEAASSGSSEGGSTSKAPLPPPVANGPDNIDPALHLVVKRLTQARAPWVAGEVLVMTWKGSGDPRFVAAAFEHEAYRQKHVFWKNEHGVYFLVYDLTADTPTDLRYRLIVDGLWQADTTNPDRVRSPQGAILSRFQVPGSALPAHHGPVVGYHGEVTFSYHGPAGRSISIIGPFNQWDPFATPLAETTPGNYSIRLTLPPGPVLYRLVDGLRSFLDPQNLHTGHDAQGMKFSYLENTYREPAHLLEATVATASAHH